MGTRVSLFDAAAQPFSGASRWNEGKIHLGYIYSADPSLRTARHVLPGALCFKPLLEEILGCRIGRATSMQDDLFLCHRQSVVSPDAMEDYYRRVTMLVREQPRAADYLADLSDCTSARLSASELSRITDSPDIVAGFRVPERSVSTLWVADRYIEALAAEPRIEQRMGTRITAARPRQAGDPDGAWEVESSSGVHGPFDGIVNALWEGRMAIDATAGMAPAGVWSNRFRLSIFLRTSVAVEFPCMVIATGPFGDIKNYNGRDFYLSWYPDGLRVDSPDLVPPVPPPLDAPSERALCESIFDNLARLLPGTARIRANAEHLALRGGWVFAAGRGLLSDPKATLHRRSEFGITRLGSYWSVDTGKYSAAPWLGRKLAQVVGERTAAPG